MALRHDPRTRLTPYTPAAPSPHQVAGLSATPRRTTVTEDRLAMRLHLIRKEAERAIRDGTRLDPHLVRDMTVGMKA